MWVVYSLLSAVIWGLGYAISEDLFNQKVSPIILILLELMFGSVTFTTLVFSSQIKYQLVTIFHNSKLLCLTIIAVIAFNIANYLIYLSIQTKNATMVGLIEISYPLFTIIFSIILFKTSHMNAGVIVGGVLIFIGVSIITYVGY